MQKAVVMAFCLMAEIDSVSVFVCQPLPICRFTHPQFHLLTYLLKYLFHRAESFMRSKLVFS